MKPESSHRWSLEEVRRFMSGALSVTDEEGAFCFHRFTKPVADFYASNDALRVRMRCPAGVCLRFASDTRWIRLVWRYRESARPFYQGCVEADGMAGTPCGPLKAVPRWEGEGFRQDERRRREFCVWMPHMCVAELAGLETEEGAMLEPARPPKFRWLAFGDSVTQGMVARWPHLTYPSRLIARRGGVAHNFGVGGATLHAALAEGVPAEPFDLATVMYGLNDFNQGRPVGELGPCAAALLRALHARAPKARLALITPTPWIGHEGPNKIGATLGAYRSALREAVRDLPQVTVIEGPSLIPADPSLYVDGIHPNESGMDVFAGSLAAALDREGWHGSMAQCIHER
ncbi:MAG: hypothetical protein HY343_04905 [Lentisphaerae bacterium]|nr:hypothetical protein [Lentisphaerota bacterium]